VSFAHSHYLSSHSSIHSTYPCAISFTSISNSPVCVVRGLGARSLREGNRAERYFYSSSNQAPEEKGEGKPVRAKDKMASDEDYAAFLDKANRDPNEGVVKSQSGGKVQLRAVDDGVKVPAVLQKATKDAFYVSDADEPFEPVVLGLKGEVKGLPNEATFSKLVGHPSPKDADVSILDIGEWDPQGEYKDLVDAVREATKGSDVRVYRIAKDGSRAEYWLVGIADGKLVGVKALAVES